MEPAIQRQLNDKLYDKRKQGALDLERAIRDALAEGDHDRLAKIIHQLCHDYAYAVHQPHARNGGLIGLAAASIALGTDEVARYLPDIVPPVLACFSDQDARVRYYACESMYNIAKVAKGEILLFFNDTFDALCKLAADSELSVKNGAELLDRLIKDIVSESAATYVSILQTSSQKDGNKETENIDSASREQLEPPMAFSLPRFIPLLQERIHVMNPYTRTFLVLWITLLDTIPDLELVSYLPAFLSGLFKFLSDPNRDVYVATQGVLDRFLNEIKKIAKIKRGIVESRRAYSEVKAKNLLTVDPLAREASNSSEPHDTSAIEDDEDGQEVDDDLDDQADDDWIPGQDVQVDHAKILEIMVDFLDPSSEEEIQLTALRWIDSFFDISPEDILSFVPRLLSQVLPAMASGVDQVRQAANRVNISLMDYIASLPDEPNPRDAKPPPINKLASSNLNEPELKSRHNSTAGVKSAAGADEEANGGHDAAPISVPPSTLPSVDNAGPAHDLDYSNAVASLTLHFLNEHEATRVAALSWLIMLHRKAPRKVLATNDGTFPALLKTLSDSSENVVTRDLQLLSQISRNSDDSYFTSFMGSLMQLFCTDRRLLETRGNLIIRQLCISLSAERIYRILAETIEKEEDAEFASIMVQNLNNNLITAPELMDLRRRLRNLEHKDGQTFFVTLFRAWCQNAVATFSLCLLAQAYEQAYNLLQVFAELEMTVNMLIQIDKLVQLLESPVFTYLRLQLLEPEKYPYLYKCLYGLLMLLPQSSAFAALKNRLNSVSAIGYLHVSQRASLPSTPTVPYDRPNRLKSRDETGNIRWVDLLEKFKSAQDRAKRRQSAAGQSGSTAGMIDGLGSPVSNSAGAFSSEGGPGVTVSAAGAGAGPPGMGSSLLLVEPGRDTKPIPATVGGIKNAQARPSSAEGLAIARPGSGAAGNASGGSSSLGNTPGHKPKSSLGNLSRFARGVGGHKSRK